MSMAAAAEEFYGQDPVIEPEAQFSSRSLRLVMPVVEHNILWAYVMETFEGTVYTLDLKADDDASATLDALSAYIDTDDTDYADDPASAQERADVTQALQETQMRSIANHDA